MLCARLIVVCCFIASLMMAGSCANIVPPGGGRKDTTLPVLRNISPPDSQLMARPKKIELQFDEYITLADAANQIQISPLLPTPLIVTSTPKRVVITIPDTSLQDATTYRITYGTAIRDLHENNPYPGKGYLFSTGSYFDSLRIHGAVYDARTGLPDSAAVVMLYSVADGDSAVVRHKPMYVVHADAAGNFSMSGLPPRAFRLYAMRDANSNLIFDGGKEAIAFADSIVRPAEATHGSYILRSFQEAASGDTVTTTATDRQRALFESRGVSKAAEKLPPGSYRVAVDTSDSRKRTEDINGPLIINFGRKPSQPLNREKIFLSTDSAGTLVEEGLRIASDSSGLRDSLFTKWKENAVYNLRLQKGFAKDSGGSDLLPGRFSFRTKRDEDYGKLRIHMPTKYYGRGAILIVSNERDTVWQAPVLDSMVSLPRVPPGVYTLRVIVDENRNGRWDAGDLFLRRQPEVVVPYGQPINLKAGWEQQIDFEAPRVRKLGAEGENKLPDNR